jgi:hypothetical protein
VDADRLAIRGVNSCTENLAIVRQQRQNVNETFATMAKLGPDHFGPAAMLAQRSDRGGERNGLVGGNHSALLGAAQAAARRRVSRRPGQCQAKRDKTWRGQESEQKGGKGYTGDRHGPVL